MRNLSAYVIAALIAIVLLGSSLFVVNESQTAIVLNLGKVVRTDLKPGLHFKVPLIEDVRRFDRRILTLDDAPERYLTSEKKDVEDDFFVKWRIKNVATFYRAASGGDEKAAKDRLAPMVKNALNNEINQLALQEVVSSSRSDLTNRLLTSINVAAATLGVEVIDVRIKRINLPQDSEILKSVFNRMRAERTRVANQLRAEGKQGGEVISAEADRASQVILADAERDAQVLRGEGDARAAELGAAAYGQDAEFYAFYRSLEAYRASLADGKTTMVIDPDSEFLRYYRNDGPLGRRRPRPDRVPGPARGPVPGRADRGPAAVRGPRCLETRHGRPVDPAGQPVARHRRGHADRGPRGAVPGPGRLSRARVPGPATGSRMGRIISQSRGDLRLFLRL